MKIYFIATMALFCVYACSSNTGLRTTDVSTAKTAAEVVDVKSESDLGQESIIEVAEIPGVPVAMADREPAIDPIENRFVCRREKQTGSHRTVRVCRTHVEMNNLESDGEDVFKGLHRSQKEY